MNLMRDDFPESVKTQLAKRVGYRCSRPDCQRATSGPSLTTPQAVNMGVAAHITAASPGGVRYDPSLTSEQRKSYENGIWLCKYCGDLVDKDAMTYPVQLLLDWKASAEQRAGMEVHRLPQSQDELSTPQQTENRLENWVKEGKTRWDELVAKDLGKGQPFKYEHGYWIAAYHLTGNLNPVEPGGLRSLLSQTESYRIGSNGYAVWAVTDGSLGELTTNSYYDLLECWMGKDPDLDAVYSHFWRASTEGPLFLLRGYQEDCESDKVPPGTVLWVETPICEAGEILLHSQRLAGALGDESASVAVHFVWEGLTDRNLASRSRSHPRLGKRLDQIKMVCHQPSASSQFTVSVKDILTNLPEIVETITKPLYQCFNFYEPSGDFIRQEISKLTKNNL
jgi:hypothetical protein